jgi:diguanylate cyclase (GGDEF)-like protein
MSRGDLALNRPIWLLYGSMFAIFAAAVVILGLLVPGLRMSHVLPFAGLLAVVALSALCTPPPAAGTVRGHVALASVYVCVAIGMFAFEPRSLIPLSPVMFLGEFAASRIGSRRLVCAHYVAASVVLAIPVVVGTTGSSATFAVVAILLAMWTLGFCAIFVMEIAEDQGGRLAQLVRRDPLTGVGNRRLLREAMDEQIGDHDRRGSQFSVLALDLNGFKALNDAMGHAAGDAVLRNVAGTLSATVRDRDVVVRQGGDEFCVLLGDCGLEQARFAERAIRTALSGLADGSLPITTGIGIATFPHDGKVSDVLLAAADARLAIDKAHGDPRSAGASYDAIPTGSVAAATALARSPSTESATPLARRDVARTRALWLMLAAWFATDAFLAAGCVMLLPGAARWSPVLCALAAAAAACMFFARQGPRPGAVSNHLLVAGIYLFSASFMAAFPAAAGAAFGTVILAGPIASALLARRSEIVAHCLSATLVFAAIIAFGLVDLTTSLSILATLPTMYGLAVAGTAVLEAIDRQGGRLEQLIRHDPLTGVGNRRMLAEQLERELSDHRRTHQPLTVLALDLNGFKGLNDQFGHAAGDVLLRAVAQAIQRVVGDEGTVVRQGGDEFCVLLPNRDGYEAKPIVDAIRASLTTIDAHGLTITTGIGIASYPSEATSPDGLLNAADQLLRASKQTAPARQSRTPRAAPAA